MVLYDGIGPTKGESNQEEFDLGYEITQAHITRLP